jgi:hypothetical protein
MSILLEVVQEGLAHLRGAPLVLLVDKRHVCGLRVAVEGSRLVVNESRAAGKGGSSTS